MIFFYGLSYRNALLFEEFIYCQSYARIVAIMSIEQAKQWSEHDPDPTTRAEINALLENPDLLADRFSGRLKFGTAGLRGLMGGGSNRINRAVILQTGAGLATYMLKAVEQAKSKGIVIGYDGRHGSKQFAQDTAAVFASKGFKIHQSSDVMATPVCAYAVTKFKAAGGVMVTASHNPPEYNGYKVYWENGAQIIPPHDKGIAACIEEAGWADDILNACPKNFDSHVLDQEFIDSYLAEILAALPKEKRAATTVAYSGMHGVGHAFVKQTMDKLDFVTFESEKSQEKPDGDFPTVKFPNPEEPNAMDNVLALGKNIDADVVMANDPDADRLAVAVKHKGQIHMLTGDQIGVLLADYMLQSTFSKPVVATTIVSSQLLEKIAEDKGAECLTTLTGFKWIANAAMNHKAKHQSQFVMGYEEAIGYTIGETVKDKDGVSAAMMFAGMVGADKAQNKGAMDRLEAIYKKHGIFVTSLVSKKIPGQEGAKQILQMMEDARNNPPQRLCGTPLSKSLDLLEEGSGFPKSNVLIYKYEDGSRVIMRPSGTEPKIKFYYEVRQEVNESDSFETSYEQANQKLNALEKAHQESLSS